MKSFLDGSFGIERETSINLRRHFAGDDLQNFFAELNKEVVESSIDLFVNVLAVLLAIFYSSVDEFSILGFL